MAISYKFVYAIIFFIFLFLVANNVEGYIVCITDNDCPENTEVRQYECIEGRCRLSRVLNP
ncbi:putative Late nodulin [Medicago truncatula]|uniref:Nodule Cysteine-Rich (NCR) secreted peptide n=1 Tax=Medicago truncatula TaxID=3880 RepID=A0A072UVD6_MEDTR|nr:Nodule Cysteine-Rich (NCR) secreted peptide [Medicago truncatula]RHN65721.1 putative Late nodulin [Medicago truncatula]